MKKIKLKLELKNNYRDIRSKLDHDFLATNSSIVITESKRSSTQINMTIDFVKSYIEENPSKKYVYNETETKKTLESLKKLFLDLEVITIQITQIYFGLKLDLDSNYRFNDFYLMFCSIANIIIKNENDYIYMESKKNEYLKKQTGFSFEKIASLLFAENNISFEYPERNNKDESNSIIITIGTKTSSFKRTQSNFILSSLDEFFDFKWFRVFLLNFIDCIDEIINLHIKSFDLERSYLKSKLEEFNLNLKNNESTNFNCEEFFLINKDYITNFNSIKEALDELNTNPSTAEKRIRKFKDILIKEYKINNTIFIDFKKVRNYFLTLLITSFNENYKDSPETLEYIFSHTFLQYLGGKNKKILANL
ncbi:MAG: hypothetical protein ACRCZO_17450 [Cetobacterium sp.]|uniref:hypothetical protein n=1 Tax=Cetobacterium sp. TaxID=2071632 RepID=UPI003F338837